MPSDIIISSVIIGFSIGGSIWWAQRDRNLEYGGTAVLGRSDDMMKKAMKEMNEKMNDMTNSIFKDFIYCVQ